MELDVADVLGVLNAGALDTNVHKAVHPFFISFCSMSKC